MVYSPPKRSMNKLFITILLLLAAACNSAPIAPPPVDVIPGVDVERQLVVDGLERSYIMHPPSGYDPATPAPVVLVFHGATNNANIIMNNTGLSAKADREGFIAVYLNGTSIKAERSFYWNAGACCGTASDTDVDDVAFVQAVLDDLSILVNLDPQRVYATGFSNGGMLAHRLACELPGRFAAIAAVSGTLNALTCEPGEPVSVLHIHGTADPLAPYEGGGTTTLTSFTAVLDTMDVWADLNGCDFDPVEAATGNDLLIHSVFENCAAGGAVELYTIVGGGHVWPAGRRLQTEFDEPARDIRANDLIWDFFAANPKP